MNNTSYIVYAFVSIALVVYFLLKKRTTSETLAKLHKVRSKEGAPKILYLRSFNFDGESFGSDISQQLKIFPFELEIVASFKSFCYLTAVGKPGEPVPEIGFDRKYFSNETWKTEVLQLMKESTMIFYRPDTSNAVLWEFEQIIKMGYKNKTLICADMGYSDYYSLRKIRYNILRKKLIETLNETIPEFNKYKIYIALNKNANWEYYSAFAKTPVVITLSDNYKN